MAKKTYIIPLQKSTEISELSDCIASIKSVYGSKNSEFIVAYTKDLADEIKDAVNSAVGGYVDITFVQCEKRGLPSLINNSVLKCSTKLFTVVTTNMRLNEYSLSNLENYSENNECSAYLYIGQSISTVDKKDFVGFVNEIIWSRGFSTVEGYLDTDALLAYAGVNPMGGFFNTEDFITCGRLKEEYGILSWYKLLMSMASKGKRIYVIPRIGFTIDYNPNTYISDYLRDVSELDKFNEKTNELIGKIINEYAPEKNNDTE